MKLYAGNGDAIEAVASARPKFSKHGGKTWDHHAIFLDGIPAKMWYDSTWGYNAYFEYGGRWYGVSLVKYEGYIGFHTPFFTKKPEVNEDGSR